MRKEKRVPPFFRAISGACAFRQAIRVWPHSEIFTGRRPVKMLVGELPKPAQTRRTSGQSVQKSLLSAARSYRSWAL